MISATAAVSFSEGTEGDAGPRTSLAHAGGGNNLLQQLSLGSTSGLTRAKAPGGVALLILLGVGLAVTGVVHGLRGLRKSFEKHLAMPSSPTARTGVTVLGVTGYVAKGIVLLLTGLPIAIAALQAHPEESTGLDGGLRALRDQPFGAYLLAAVGAGLICYGVYMIVRARLARMTQ